MLRCTPVTSAGPSFSDIDIARHEMIMTLQVPYVITPMQKFSETVNTLKCQKTWENHNLITVWYDSSRKKMILYFLIYECSGTMKTPAKLCLMKQTQGSSKHIFFLNVFFKNKLLQHIRWNSKTQWIQWHNSYWFQQRNNFISGSLMTANTRVFHKLLIVHVTAQKQEGCKTILAGIKNVE